jgi:hypothetical protein
VVHVKFGCDERQGSREILLDGEKECPFVAERVLAYESLEHCLAFVHARRWVSEHGIGRICLTSRMCLLRLNV